MESKLILRSVSKFLIFLTAALSSLISCDDFSEARQGGMIIRFSGGPFATKSVELPDSNDFILRVSNSDGESVYDGKFGNLPEKLIVNPGNYNVSVRSAEFSRPLFSAPQYGDDQCVVVPPGGVQSVELVCTQLNSGIKLDIAPNFLESYPKAVIFVNSAEGRLLYSYSEERIAYFLPGELSIIMDNAGKQTNLLTRKLEAKEVLRVGINAPFPDASEEGVGQINVVVDTTRNWIDTDIIIGGSGNGAESNSAIDVTTARKSPGAENIWVYGYICGSFKSSGNIVFEDPYPTSTNLAISGRTSTSSKESCLSVELKKGEMRDLLNLMDNPDNKGKKLFIKGDIVESYYGIPGVKNITEYELY